MLVERGRQVGRRGLNLRADRSRIGVGQRAEDHPAAHLQDDEQHFRIDTGVVRPLGQVLGIARQRRADGLQVGGDVEFSDVRSPDELPVGDQGNSSAWSAICGRPAVGRMGPRAGLHPVPTPAVRGSVRESGRRPKSRSDRVGSRRRRSRPYGPHRQPPSAPFRRTRSAPGRPLRSRVREPWLKRGARRPTPRRPEARPQAPRRPSQACSGMFGGLSLAPSAHGSGFPGLPRQVSPCNGRAARPIQDDLMVPGRRRPHNWTKVTRAGGRVRGRPAGCRLPGFQHHLQGRAGWPAGAG